MDLIFDLADAKYLNSIDYLPNEICELHYIDEVLVQVDLLFIRKKYLNLINNKDKILKILSNLMLFMADEKLI